MTQDKETLREAVARAICKANLFDPDKLQENAECEPQPMWMAYIPDADAAIATMFERLRTPSDEALRAGCNKIDWERNPQEHMPTAPNGIVDLNSTFLTPGATTIGQDMLDAWQAMLDKFQQENSNGR